MNARALAVLLALLLTGHDAAAKKRVIRGPRTKEAPACKTDRDCALLPSVCGRCPPCEPTWHPVGTRKEAEHIRSIAIRARCKPMSCGPCGGGQIASTQNWLGNRVACRKGRCVAEHVVEIESNRVCKVDDDCAFRPRDGCGCPTCGLTQRDAVNRKHAEWLRKQFAIESCPPRPTPCAACTQPVRWVGEKAACRLGQCVVLP